MKKLFILLILCALLLSACSATRQPRYKRDCRGLRHERQPGGFYL